MLEGVHAQVNALNNGILPPDVKVVPYIDRTDLVHTTVTRVGHTLLEGMGLVLIVLILFLGSARAALMVAVTVPFSLLFAFICMRFTNIPANLLSLGAIDFGIIVDASIVVMENILRHREENPDWVMSEDDAVASAIQVARPIFFATLIIITAYLPLFAFQRVEKKVVFSHGVRRRLFADWSVAHGSGDYSRPCTGDLSEARQTVSQSSSGIHISPL